MWSVRCWGELATPLNLWRAWREFSRDKRRRPDVAAFSVDADRHVHRMARALAAEAWRPGGYRLLFITDPKRRVIAAARVEDRVVHHALHRLVAPRFLRGFIAQSYACLPDRGSHRAVLRFQACARRHRYALQLDVRRYFYSIDRAVLREVLFRHLPEPPLRRLLAHVLESGADLYQRREVVDWLGWDGPGRAGAGLPIGNLTSQLWGNVYLDGLDHHVTRVLRPGPYQRYMDDVTLFGDDRERLLDARERIAEWLARERHLELKDPQARPVRTDGEVHYLGYVVTRRGLRPGPKARGRLPHRLARAATQTSTDPSRLHSAIASYAAVWRFGL